jgi:glycosyltransferase involved in cell wall biosynthesis
MDDHDPQASALRAALAHDYLLVLRGAERTFREIARMWPTAPISTLLYDERGTLGEFAGHPIRTSPVQRLGIRQNGFRRLLPVLPAAAQRLTTGPGDVVVSSSSAFAHGFAVAPGVPHVCYCHSPFRYAWFETERALAEAGRVSRPVLRQVLGRIRSWDLAAARRVTRYVANSRITRERIREIYGRDAEIVHPPVEVERFRSGPSHGYFMTVTELVAHKRVELAVAAAQAAGRPLRVVGGGPELERLRERYASTEIEILGRVSDDDLVALYEHAEALIVPNVEEFGIAAVEAQAAGRPVIAARGGGTLETVVAGGTGTFVAPGDYEELVGCLRDFDAGRFDAAEIRRHALRFSAAEFRRRLAAEVDAAVSTCG